MIDPERAVRAVAKKAVRRFGEATSAVRVLPNFLIIGGQRCGTTSLYADLRQHPAVAPCIARDKEVHFFDLHYDRDLAWYRSHFPTRWYAQRLSRKIGVPVVVGEATPDYIFDPFVPERVHAFNPNVKLVALLRDPVHRAVSHYHHERTRGRETLSLREALQAEPERVAGEVERMARDSTYTSFALRRHTYVSRGLYYEQILRWLKFFPREQLLVIASDDLFGEPAAVMAELSGFLGIPVQPLKSYRHTNMLGYDQPEPDILEDLAQRFAGPNEELYSFLGRDLGWTTPRAAATGKTRSA